MSETTTCTAIATLRTFAVTDAFAEIPDEDLRRTVRSFLVSYFAWKRMEMRVEAAAWYERRAADLLTRCGEWVDTKC